MSALQEHPRLLTVKKMAVGIELSGDLQAPWSNDDRQCLRDLFDEHGLLLFRDQQLTHEQHRSVMNCIGPIPSMDGMGYVSVDPHEGSLGSSELVFHSDSSWSPYPYLAISSRDRRC